jgi:hypothetical protein
LKRGVATEFTLHLTDRSNAVEYVDLRVGGAEPEAQLRTKRAGRRRPGSTPAHLGFGASGMPNPNKRASRAAGAYSAHEATATTPLTA